MRFVVKGKVLGKRVVGGEKKFGQLDVYQDAAGFVQINTSAGLGAKTKVDEVVEVVVEVRHAGRYGLQAWAQELEK